MSLLRNKVPTEIKFHTAINDNHPSIALPVSIGLQRGNSNRLLALDILYRTYVTAQILQIDET